MKHFHLAFIFMFLFFATLQWNDIDGPMWMGIYLTSALLAFIAYKEICLPCTLAWAALIGLFVTFMLIMTAPGFIESIKTNHYSEIFSAMNDNKPHIEQTREALGLAIILFYCCSIFISTYVKRTKQHS